MKFWLIGMLLVTVLGFGLMLWNWVKTPSDSVENERGRYL